jgi:hypothetical protein
MTEAYVEDVSFRTMREGDILEEVGASFDDANEPERLTLVLDMGCSLDSLGLHGSLPLDLSLVPPGRDPARTRRRHP